MFPKESLASTLAIPYYLSPICPAVAHPDTKLTHLMYNYFGEPWHPQGELDNLGDLFLDI